MNNERQQAITKAKAEYEAQGYNVTTDEYELTATKGIYSIWEVFYANGQKRYIITSKNDKLDGAQKRWYRGGQQFCIHNYKNDKLDGKQFEWKEDGTPLPTELWEDDVFIKYI